VDVQAALHSMVSPVGLHEAVTPGLQVSCLSVHEIFPFLLKLREHLVKVGEGYVVVCQMMDEGQKVRRSDVLATGR